MASLFVDPTLPSELSGFSFAACELNLRTRRLLFNGAPRHLERKTFDLLVFLIVNRDRAVTKRELNAALWGGCAVSDGALTQCVWTARRAIGDVTGRSSRIQTLTGVGYRFVGEVAVRSVIRAAAPGSTPRADALGERLVVEAMSRLQVAQDRAARGASLAFAGSATPTTHADEDCLFRAAVACRQFADAVLGTLAAREPTPALMCTG